MNEAAGLKIWSNWLRLSAAGVVRLFCLVRQYYAPPTTDNLGLMEQEVWAYAHLVLHFNLNYKNKNLGTILLASHMKIQNFFSWTHLFNSDKQSWCIPLTIQQRALSKTRLHPGKDQALENLCNLLAVGETTLNHTVRKVILYGEWVLGGPFKDHGYVMFKHKETHHLVLLVLLQTSLLFISFFR